jgi:hypothetical protein
MIDSSYNANLTFYAAFYPDEEDYSVSTEMVNGGPDLTLRKSKFSQRSDFF